MIIKVSEACYRNRDVRVARRRARAGNDSHLFRDDVIVAPLVPSSLGSIRPQRRFDGGRRRRRRRLPASLVFFLRNFPTHSPLTSPSLSGSAIVTGAIRWWWSRTDRQAGGEENSESAFASSLHFTWVAYSFRRIKCDDAVALLFSLLLRLHSLRLYSH